MGDREKTKHKGIYRVGSNYYVIYNDGTTRLSKKGDSLWLIAQKFNPLTSHQIFFTLP